MERVAVEGRVLQEVYGCTASAGEAEILKEILEGDGVRFTESEEDARWVIIHTCVVIEHTERRMLRRIEKHLSSGRRVIVAGCLPKARPEVLEKYVRKGDLFVVDTHEVPKMESVAERIKGIVGAGGEGEGGMVWGVGKTRGIVPISTGCLGSCTYCITRIARGSLRSFPMEWILSRLQRMVNEGRREIYITSQDTSAYGMDRGGPYLPDLLKMVSEVEGKFMVRVGMMNPWTASIVLDDLLHAYTGDKIYKFFHVPVQSGSNTILKAMKRPYTVEEFEEIIRRIKERYPDALISTDIIVGFPGESEEDFELSVKLVERVRPPVLNITRFSPRPGTEAERMEGRIPGWVVKRRSRLLTELHREVSRKYMEGWVGKTFEGLAVEVDESRGTTLFRNEYYLPVVVRGRFTPGEFRRTEVLESRDFYVLGKVV